MLNVPVRGVAHLPDALQVGPAIRQPRDLCGPRRLRGRADGRLLRRSDAGGEGDGGNERDPFHSNSGVRSINHWLVQDERSNGDAASVPAVNRTAIQLSAIFAIVVTNRDLRFSVSPVELTAPSVPSGPSGPSASASIRARARGADQEPARSRAASTSAPTGTRMRKCSSRT